MRKLLLLFMAMSVLTLASCGLQLSSSNSGSDSLATDSIEDIDEAAVVFDSVSVQRKYGRWNYTSNVTYPVSSPDELLATMREWMNTILVCGVGEEVTRKFEGDVADGKAMVNFYADEFKTIADLENNEDLPEDIECEYINDLTVDTNNERFVSLTYSNYAFLGGAHGSTTVIGASFLKGTGEKFGWDMFISKNAVQKLIKDGVKEFFEVKTDKELEECLILVDDQTVNTIPLPNTEPWLNDKGAVILYQQHEICSYAAGMPTFIIPWSKVKALLKPEYQSLVK